MARSSLDSHAPRRGRGRGKVILLGEHAVVYAHPALAGALDAGVVALAEPADEDALEIPAWGVAAPIGAAVAAVKAALGIERPFRLVAEATVPARAGLGSSAALAVAATRALAAAEGRALTDAEVERIADRAERVFHENPSGVDVALAARGGFGVFRRGIGLEPVAAPPVRLAIGLSGTPRSTGAMVAHVRGLGERATADLAALGDLAIAGQALLTSGRPAALAPLFDEAQARLGALEVSTPVLERLCALARAVGAGAKLTGAGGGGAVIAIGAPGAEEAAVAAWRAAGFEAFVAEVGTCA